MRRTRVRGPGFSTALLLGFALVVGCGKGGGDAGGGGGSGLSFEQAMEKASVAAATLTEIRDRFPATLTLREQSCPDADIETWSPESKQRLVRRIHWNELLRITAGEDSLRTNSLFSHSLTGMRMSGLPTPGKKPGNSSQVVDAVKAFERTHYLAVTRPTVVREPSVGASRFTPGRFDAWVVVYRLSDRSPICQAKLEARNSEQVSYSTRSGAHEADQSSKRDYAVREDLKRQVTTAYREAMGRISKVLR